MVVARVAAMTADATLAMSVVTQAELLLGVELLPDGKLKRELHEAYRKMLGEFALIVDVDSRIAEAFAGVFAELRRKGRPIGTNDVWIAATARALDITLVTADAHFGFIDKLRIENWTTSPARE